MTARQRYATQSDSGLAWAIGRELDALYVRRAYDYGGMAAAQARLVQPLLELVRRYRAAVKVAP